MSQATDHGQTPSQTIGPFFHDALMRDRVDDLDPNGRAGARMVITGRVLDGDGAPVTDAMLEVWQSDGAGRYRHPIDPRRADVPDGFVGFGRIATDATGTYHLATVRPGTVPGPAGSVQAPHLNVHLFARGLLDQVWTRIYLADDPHTARDPILAAVPAGRRGTLLARPVEIPGAQAAYRHDIVLQGPNETVFFQT